MTGQTKAGAHHSTPSPTQGRYLGKPAPATLERAIEIAAHAHAGQLAPDGTPYILHPLRLMVVMKSPDDRIVAVLHDVLEKTKGWSVARLRREGFAPSVVDAVESLTQRPGESYEHSIAPAKANRIGRHVKRADITDHLRHFPPESNRSDYPGALLNLLAP